MQNSSHERRRKTLSRAARAAGAAIAFALLAAAPGPRAFAGISRTFRAGVAWREINPLKPTVVIGPASSPEHDTRYNDLKTKATVIEDSNKKRVAIVSADILYFSDAMADELKEEIKKRFALPPEAVLINASHSHSGPPLDPLMVDTPSKIDPEWVAKLKAQVVGAVGDAIAAMRPASLTLVGDTCGFAINRRVTRNGQTSMLPNPSGSADREVAVLALRDPDSGELFGMVVKYACHPVTMSLIGVGSDYPGFAMDELERRHPGAVAQFVQGCSGDCRPAMIDETGKKFIPGTLELCKGFGMQLADAADRSLEKVGLWLEGGLDWRMEEAKLPIRPAPREELAEFAKSDAWHLKRWGEEGLARLDAGETPAAFVPMRVQVIQIGLGMLDFASMRFVALGGEVFSGYSLALQEKTFPYQTVVLGYSNGMAGYIPTAEEIPKGGYEVTAYRTWDTPGPFTAEIEPIILEAAGGLAEKSIRKVDPSLIFGK